LSSHYSQTVSSEQILDLSCLPHLTSIAFLFTSGREIEIEVFAQTLESISPNLRVLSMQFTPRSRDSARLLKLLRAKHLVGPKKFPALEQLNIKLGGEHPYARPLEDEWEDTGVLRVTVYKRPRSLYGV
jgi:hypothetical protein